MKFNFANINEYPERLTKEAILERISDKQIMEHYLGKEISFTGKIHSPFRVDEHPSLSFKRTESNTVIWRDWGIDLAGDVFKFVQTYYNCNFIDALKYINQDLCLNIGGITKPKNPAYTLIGYTKPPTYKKKENRIIIQGQPFTLADINYWKQYGIQLSTLVKYRVKSARFVWLNDKLLKKYSNSSPVYAYRFVGYKKISYKIYEPYSEKNFKWLYNGDEDMYQGYDQLPWLGDLLILTKSLKDCMTLYELGYNAFSLQGEGNKLKAETVDRLLKRYERIIVFYDNDKQGITSSNKISEQYGFDKIYIPDEYGIKDISDFHKEYGRIKTEELLKGMI